MGGWVGGWAVFVSGEQWGERAGREEGTSRDGTTTHGEVGEIVGENGNGEEGGHGGGGRIRRGR